jgi:hypothetical protein
MNHLHLGFVLQNALKMFVLMSTHSYHAHLLSENVHVFGYPKTERTVSVGFVLKLEVIGVKN